MSKARRSFKEQAEARLLDAWEGEPSFGPPVGCLATTYTFDAGFFETECLGRFVGMESEPNEDPRTYVLEREDRFSGMAFAGILVDAAHVAKERSLRWRLFPVQVPGGGVMHAKVALLAWQRHVRVLISSANLTEPGYRRNWENQMVLDSCAEEPGRKEVVLDILKFLRGLAGMSVGGDRDQGPGLQLRRFFDTVEKKLKKWPAPLSERGEPRVVFASVGLARQTLFEQLAGLLGGPATNASVVSPFFDQGDGALKTLAGLETLLKQRGERSLTIVAPGRHLPDDTIEIDIPQVLGHSAMAALKLEHKIVRDVDEDGNARALHAKILWLRRDDTELFVFGSSNFTQAGTGIGRTNIEANLVYVIPPGASDFARICEQAFPPSEIAEVEGAVLLARFKDSGEGDAVLPLPVAFGEALFYPGDGNGHVEIEFLGDPPAGFSVLGPSGQPVLDEQGWISAGRPARYRVPWQEAKPPAHLEVSWSDAAGTRRVGIWPVNVSDTSDLPPPAELRTLTLEELMEVLTASRPLYETVARILRRREKQGLNSNIELDPHKKVDTRDFLLRRVKRLSLALEGLRERLARPLFAIESLRWRLQGPLGAVALAGSVSREEGEGAAFMIVEIAQVVADMPIQAEGGLDRSEIRGEIAKAVSELARMARQHDSPSNLRDYVEAALKEMAA